MAAEHRDPSLTTFSQRDGNHGMRPPLFHSHYQHSALQLLVALVGLSILSPSLLWAAAPSESVSLRLQGPTSPLQIGTVRFEARLGGEKDSRVAAIRFLLDGELAVQRRLAPYTASIHLGRLPEQHIVTAIAVDEQGQELARDELVLNRQRNSFSVRFVQPSSGSTNTSNLDNSTDKRSIKVVELDLNLPPDAKLDHIDLFLGESKVHVFDQAPFTTRVVLTDRKRTSYLRAVAQLLDGNTREAIVFVNAPDVVENIAIQYVQLYVGAHHRRTKRPVLDLTKEDLSITEDGHPQKIRRFEKVSDLALNLAVLLDVSASMGPRLAVSTQAALGFFEETMRPSDRATLITFDDRPSLAVGLTADTKELAAGLLGAKAQRGTALYDSLVFALYQLSGVTGQRATLLLSDGNDETSTLRYEDALEYAKRAGIPIYAIRLQQDRKARRARAELIELTSSTGGRAFFIQEAAELEGIYKIISEELRSRFLVTYQSNQQTTNPRFREIHLDVSRKGVLVSTRRGYYP